MPIKALFFLFFVHQLISQEIKLARVIVEPQDNAIHELFLYLNNSKAVTSLIRKTSSSETHYPTASLKAGDVILTNVKGKDVISMTCPKFQDATGGLVTVKYLHNGITMSYHAITLELVKEGETWALYNHEKKRIHTLTLKARKLAGLLIGIQSIELLSY